MTATPYDRLRDLLLAAHWEPDTPLREEQLAKELGTSRTPVRDALRRLEADGLVEIAPRRGARVVGFTAADVDSIYDLRAVLEGFAAKSAAHTGAADVEHLAELAARMESLAAAGDREALIGVNHEFHHQIHVAAANPLLVSLLRSVVATSLVHRAYGSYDVAELQRSMGHHRELIAALRARDAGWAEGVMVAHIRAAHSVIRRRSDAPNHSTSSDNSKESA